MAELSKYFEREDLGGGRFRNSISLRPIAFLNNGTFQRIINNFADGDVNFPHIVTAAGFFSYITPQGDWRIHPTRDPQVWFSIGAPFINPASPTRVSMNPLTRSGNVLTSVNTNFDARIINGGHTLKLEFQLKNGFVPPQGKVAFPINAQGVTRVGNALLVGGTTVMYLPPPIVYDAATPRTLSRPIAVAFQSIGGTQYIIYTLPDLTGMTAPVIDPTLSLQPDATAGIDTWTLSGSTSLNCGVTNRLAVGQFSSEKYRTLIKFDLSSIPAGATVSSAILSLYLLSDFANTTGAWAVYRMKRAWVEGTGNIGATGDGATWATYDGSNNWQTAGAEGINDREATDIGTLAFTAAETLNVLKNISLSTSAIQGMITGGGFTNNGFQVQGTETDNTEYDFASSDHATAANRPKLEVVYTTGGGVPILTDGGIHSTLFGALVR